jgi:hypothetical protein
MQFGTDATERMRIDSSGNVGIGTASPNFKEEVNQGSGSAAPSLRQTPQLVLKGWGGSGTYHSGIGFSMSEHTAGYWGSGILEIDDSGSYGAALGFYTSTGAASASPTEKMRISSSGNVGIGGTPIRGVRLTAKGAGTSSAGYSIACYDGNGATAFYVRDDGVIFTGLLTNSPYNATTANAANVELANDGILRRSTSSLRYKSDVTDAAHGLADVLKLRSVTYKGKNDGNKIFGGLIAEEVHDAGLTEFVAYDNEGRPDAIHYGNMVALLTKAIQEQQAMIDELKAKVAALETK